MENQGWIKLHRKILEHPIFTSGDSYLIHLAIYLLLKVNHEDKRILFNGQEIVIKRGQGIFGLNQLVKELTPYKNENSRNFKKFKTIIYRRLKILEKLQFLKLQPTNKFTIITILNYDVYQASETPVKLQRNSSETPVKTNKNNKNDKNEKNIKNINNINTIIGLFKNVNPSYERLFANKTQRDSVERLLKKYGEAWLRSLINRLPEIIKMPYAPQITTPYELETKLGRLKVFLEQEKNKNSRMGVEKV